MPLPVIDDMLTLDFSSDGGPFANVTTSSEIPVRELNVSEDGPPFMATSPAWVRPATVISARNGVPAAGVAALDGLPVAQVKKINTLT